jgi:hypothetical protein
LLLKKTKVHFPLCEWASSLAFTATFTHKYNNVIMPLTHNGTLFKNPSFFATKKTK